MQFAQKFKMPLQIYQLALSYLDDIINRAYLEKFEFLKEKLEAISAVCLFIASKFLSLNGPSLTLFYQSVMQTNTLDDLIEAEQLALKML